MKKDSKAPWFIRILSLFFAILLYYNANAILKDQTNKPSFERLEAISQNVPVHVTYNDEKYFISGYEPTVTVNLKSSNKILLDKESNSETRSFSIVMDLTKYKEGTFEVPLQIVGLPNSVKGTVTPSKLHVTVEKRQLNTFEVQPAIDPKIFATGYEMKSATTTPPTVTLSAGDEVLSQVSRVIAGVSDRTNVTEDFSQKVQVYAINNKGETLDVDIQPETVKVDVAVDVPTKKVKINPIQAGKIPRGVKDYTFSVKEDEVSIEGPKHILDEINSIDLKIDTSNIRETVSSSYIVVVPKEVTVDPETVFVTVIPNENTSTSTKEKSTSTEKSDKISESEAKESE